MFEYISSHQQEQKRANSDSDKNLLQAFKISSNVVYQKGSIVFDIDGSAAQFWFDSLKKKSGEPTELSDGSGVQMKKDDQEIPLVTTQKATQTKFGSVTVTVYPNPKTSNPKIMIQGKMYMAFVAFILPMVIKDMNKASPLSVNNETETATNNSDDEDENYSSNDIVTLNKSFKRIEIEVLNLRDDLIERVDNTTRDHENLGLRLDSLENLLKLNIEQHNNLSQNLESLNETIKNKVNTENVVLEKTQLDRIAQGVGNLPKLNELGNTLASLRTEMAKAGWGCNNPPYRG